MKKLQEYKSWQILFIFITLSIIIRFFSFFPTVIDHDESTYLVIAKELLKGKVLYADVTDIKPVGIFYIIAAYLKIFGDSIFGFRMFGSVIIALTSFFLYKTKLKIGHPFSVAFASGIIYIFFPSVWTTYGVTVNTEHFFNLFTALGLFLIIGSNQNGRLLLFGLIMGIGFLIKIIVAFDFAAIILFLFITDLLHHGFNKKRLFFYFLSGLFFLLPFVMVNFAFYVTGYFSDFYHINYVAFRNYALDKNWLRLTIWILEFFGRFFPVSFFFFFSLFTRQKIENLIIREKLLVIIWTIFVLLSVTMAGKTFRHYMIQLMLPVAFFAGNIFHHQINKPYFIQLIFQKKTGYTLLCLIILAQLLMQKKDYYNQPDYPRAVANYLKDKMQEGDLIYTGNGHQIIYYLLDVSPPTKYVHRSLLFVPVHYNALEINPDIEFRKIFDKKPRFILQGNGSKSQILNKEIESNYGILKYFEEYQFYIYERKEKSPCGIKGID